MIKSIEICNHCGKSVTRCYAVAFDYDERSYTINEKEKKTLPLVKSISIEVE